MLHVASKLAAAVVTVAVWIILALAIMLAKLSRADDIEIVTHITQSY